MKNKNNGEYLELINKTAKIMLLYKDKFIKQQLNQAVCFLELMMLFLESKRSRSKNQVQLIRTHKRPLEIKEMVDFCILLVNIKK